MDTPDPLDPLDELADRLARAVDADSADATILLRATLSTMKEDATDPVPAATLQAAAALADRLPRAPGWLETFDRLAARVMAPLFDDGPALAMGLRGEDLRQCTLAVDDLRLDLEIEADEEALQDSGEGRVAVRAQIDAEEPLAGPVEVAVLREDTDLLVVSTRSDETGRFDLELPAGRFEWLFRLPDGREIRGTIEVP